MGRLLLVPAAGLGTRLGTETPKVLVPVNGRTMLRHILDLHAPLVDRAIIVAHPAAASRVAANARESSLPAEVVVQETPTGMLDAVLAGASAAGSHAGRVWITWGDQIAVHAATLARLAAIEGESDVAFPTVIRDVPYIHVDRARDGRVVRIRQRREGDDMPPAGESDMGVFSLSARACFEHLPAYARDAVPGAGTGERNFLPFLAWMAARGVVSTCACTDPSEAVGINTPEDLAAVAAYLARR
jgi:bifunctional UDP-N-acetylglucosamine pyrophosphorylase / glucosamine-1-phosphate N-acetyltransferase